MHRALPNTFSGGRVNKKSPPKHKKSGDESSPEKQLSVIQSLPL